MLKVAAIATDMAGCGWYRIRTPLLAAERQGLIELRHPPFKAWMPRLHATFADMTEEQRREAVQMQDFYHMAGDWADVLFTQRYNQVQFGGGFQAVSRVMGVPWVLDVDDDVFHIDEVNPASRTYRDKTEEEIADVRSIAREQDARPDELVRHKPDGTFEAVRQKAWDYMKITRRCLMLADAMVVSTDELAGLYSGHRVSAGVEARMRVVKNCVDPVIWSAPTPPQPHPGEVWIGWAGGGSHVGDLAILGRVIDKVLERYPEARFFWTRLPSPHLLRLSNKYGPRCVRLESWSPIEQWADYYTALNFDIALAPLEDTTFTRGKSNLKWLEAGILGQAMVASDCGPYQRTIHHEEDGYLVRTESQWIDAISRLVRDKATRRKVGEAARRRVLGEFSMEHNAKQWVDAFGQIIREHGESITARAESVREKGASDEVSDGDRHDPAGASVSEGREEPRQCEAGLPVGAD